MSLRQCPYCLTGIMVVIGCIERPMPVLLDRHHGGDWLHRAAPGLPDSTGHLTDGHQSLPTHDAAQLAGTAAGPCGRKARYGGTGRNRAATHTPVLTEIHPASPQ
jgi:hypothetical protein